MGRPLFKVATLRSAEAAAQAPLPAGELMRRAGRAAAAILGENAKPGHWCVVCGPGNNGGDGYAVAAELQARGREVTCVRPAKTAPTTTDACAAFARWTAGGGRVVDDMPSTTRFIGVVDALFGIGLSRPLDGVWAEASEWINRRRTESLIAALDVPSGLDADTGAWVGGIPGVSAATTITFIGDKPGLHTGDGVDAAGQVRVESLDVAVPAGDAQLATRGDLAKLFQPRARNSHKGTFGSVAVVGGGRGMVGAALLAGRAALRLGAGRVYVTLLGAPEFTVDPQQPELMFRAPDDLPEVEAIVVGCGLGQEGAAHRALQQALARPCALVIDADALNLIAVDDSLRTLLRQRAAQSLVTPHPLEAARLLGCGAGEVQRDRLGTASRLATATGAIALLKGAGTVVAGPAGRISINSTGSPALATAGSGDVLAGMLGALLAQGLDAWHAAVAGAWLHGAAVDGEDRGLVAGDIALRAMQVLREGRAAP